MHILYAGEWPFLSVAVACDVYWFVGTLERGSDNFSVQPCRRAPTATHTYCECPHIIIMSLREEADGRVHWGI